MDTARLHAAVLEVDDRALKFLFRFVEPSRDEVHPATTCPTEGREVPIGRARGEVL
jgi:hypothetical protein